MRNFLDPASLDQWKGPSHPSILRDVLSERSGELKLTESDWQRYHRQIILDQMGANGQRRLKAARVLIVGLGGLGSPVLLYLTAAGVGTLGLIDHDQVDISNLQRQVLYDADDVGELKVISAQKRALALNPDAQIMTYPFALTKKNALEILKDYDLIIDGSDNFATRYLVNDAASWLSKPYIFASIGQFTGMISVFETAHGPCYRCLFPVPPPNGSVPNCAEAGVLGTLAGMMGTMQAHEALKLITGAGKSLAGRVMILDGLTMQWRSFTLSRDPSCPTCNAKTQNFFEDQHHSPELASKKSCSLMQGDQIGDQISVKEFASLKQHSSHRLLVIDVRTEEERSRFGTIPDSHHLPLAHLEKMSGDPHHQGEKLPQESLEVFNSILKSGKTDKSTQIVIYCKAGARSLTALKLLTNIFQKNIEVTDFVALPTVKSLEGGYLAWQRHQDHLYEQGC